MFFFTLTCSRYLFTLPIVYYLVFVRLVFYFFFFFSPIFVFRRVGLGFRRCLVGERVSNLVGWVARCLVDYLPFGTPFNPLYLCPWGGAVSQRSSPRRPPPVHCTGLTFSPHSRAGSVDSPIGLRNSLLYLF